MKTERPEPDMILGQIQAQARMAERGRLKIFLGACPGVGKTYALLREAGTRAAQGEDVVAGVIETHGRPETEALLSGLQHLPRRTTSHRGIELNEFDLEAALERRPGLLLVDELAHTNAPGSRHARRWQDVLELLAAGMDVHATLNIQHMESLNDIVAQITGVRVRETVPDSVLERADEIVLIDLPPEELLKRLAEGKVYRTGPAALAANNFFRKANLIALRELALRFMAHCVDDQVRTARRGERVDTIWPTVERLLVCVGPSPSSARLIRSARRLAGLLRAEWIALSVETPAASMLDAPARDQLAENMKLAERLGGEVVTLVGENIPHEVIEYARARNVTKLIVGKPVMPWWRERLMNTVVDQIVRISGEIDVYVIRGEGEGTAAREAAPVKQPAFAWGGYAATIGIIALCTLPVGLWHDALRAVDVVMIYLLGVMWVAALGRRGPAVLASVLSVACFDLLYVPPRFTFAVLDRSYIFSFVVMLVAALLISTLTLRLKRQAAAARDTARELAAQQSVSRRLAATRGVANLIRVALDEVGTLARAAARILLPDAQGVIEPTMRVGDGPQSVDPERMVAQWVFEKGQPAGRGTETLTSTTEALYLPLRAGDQTVGVLRLEIEAPLDPPAFRLLETVAGVIGLALGVERLEHARQAMQLQVETERMWNAILSSVSHDLRTPLATIMGSAGSLLEHGDALDAATRRALLCDIHDEAERLGRLIANLLEITRLESGALELKRELQSLEEIIGSALHALRKRLAGREVLIDLEEDLPPLNADGLLLQHVFINLLENALAYTPADTAIEICACSEMHAIRIKVADRGPGIEEDKPGALEKIFDKFERGVSGAQQGSGIGLGLAICRAIIAAHGGQIRAQNREGGGLVFTIDLEAAPQHTMPTQSTGEPDA